MDADMIHSMSAEVYEILGGGYNESVYEEAMAVEFRAAGVDYRKQPTVEVMYKGHKVGEQDLDFCCVLADGIVTELKAVSSISKGHIAQLRAYMRTTGRDEGLIVNFPPDAEEPQYQQVTL